MEGTAITQFNPIWGPDWMEVRRQWLLRPDVTFLNHGSFGATPKPVLEYQAELHRQLEYEPGDFLWRRLPKLLAETRQRVGAFLGAEPSGITFLPNATTAVNTVIKSLDLGPGDELVTTNHAYPAVLNTLYHDSQRRGYRLVVTHVPLPTDENDPEGEVADCVMQDVSGDTRLLVVDGIASQTGLIFPVNRIIAACRCRGVQILVDAAHVPSVLPVNLEGNPDLTPDFWTGNFHKWAFAPKTVAALYVAPKHREMIRPLVTSLFHGDGYPTEFDWVGTYDPTPFLSLPAGLDFFDRIGGMERVRQHNRALIRLGRDLVSSALETPLPVSAAATERMYAYFALVRLPDRFAMTNHHQGHPLMAGLYDQHHFEVPFTCFGGQGYMRLSAQVYNCPDDFRRLASILPAFLSGFDCPNSA